MFPNVAFNDLVFLQGSSLPDGPDWLLFYQQRLDGQSRCLHTLRDLGNSTELPDNFSDHVSCLPKASTSGLINNYRLCSILIP